MGRLAVLRTWQQKIRVEIRKYEDQSDGEWMVAHPVGANFDLLDGYRNQPRYDVRRAGKIGGNQNATLDRLIRQLKEVEPG